MVFFTYSAIYTNKKFMNPSNINYAITGNMVATGGMVILFMVLDMTIQDIQKIHQYHYDIAYAEIFDMNKITTPTLDDILSDSQTPLTSLKTIEFISKTYITILNDENLNANLGTNIKVEKGYFISLFQIIKDDGYSHDTSEISSFNIPTKTGTNIYKPKDKITKVLFNNPLLLTNTHYIILNNKDYQDIKNIS